MLSGKYAIITGANRGIGLATMKLFAKQHATIYACCRTNSEAIEHEVQLLEKEYKCTIKPFFFDIDDYTVVKDVIKKIGKEAPGIDILVNNAGVSVESLFHMTKMETIQNTLRTNFLSQVQLAQLVSRYMIKQKKGSIINIASVAGIDGDQGGLAYGSSKAAIIFATRVMALELGQYGVRVNSVSPGFIDTDMWKEKDKKITERVLNETPLKRQGRPDEVASVILFLGSEMSSFITSQNIIVDGGRKGGVNNFDFNLDLFSEK